MLENTSANIKFTNDQNNQINQVNTILANLQDEINIATKTSNGLRKEADRITKECDYQNSLLTTVLAQIEAKNKELSEMNEQILTHRGLLNKQITEFNERSKVLDTANASLQTREYKVLENEKAYAKKESVLQAMDIDLSNEREDFYGKVAKLKEVINTF